MSQEAHEKRQQAQWASMAGVTANRPMGKIRDKEEVSGPGKPKEKR